MWHSLCKSQNAVRCHAKRLQKPTVQKMRRSRETTGFQRNYGNVGQQVMESSRLFCTFVNAGTICEGNKKLNICPFGLYDAKH